MLFDKNLFESKYVPAEQRTPVDTLILIGNGFDIWQNLDTSYRSFERYYEAHLDEVLERFHLKKYTKYNEDGTIAIDETMCNGCGLCRQLCHSDAIEEVEV